MKMNLSNSKSKALTSPVEDLGEDDMDEDGFIEGDINLANVISTFSFGMDSSPEHETIKQNQQSPASPPTDSRSAIYELYGITPRGVTHPINGEPFSLKRGYQLRPSTIRKLNELKARHPDVNAYLNTILDEAILHFYNYIFNENGYFSAQEDKKISR